VTTARDRLIEKGTELLLERGYEATGIQTVLKAARAPKGSFYHHFESKEEFALEVLDGWFAVEAQRLERALRADGEMAARLRAYFVELADTYEEAGFRRGCMLGTLGQEVAPRLEAVRGRTNEHFSAWRAALGNVISEVWPDGAAGLGADGLAAFLIDAWEGATLQAKVARSREPVERFLTVFDALVEREA